MISDLGNLKSCASTTKVPGVDSWETSAVITAYSRRAERPQPFGATLGTRTELPRRCKRQATSYEGRPATARASWRGASCGPLSAGVEEPEGAGVWVVLASWRGASKGAKVWAGRLRLPKSPMNPPGSDKLDYVNLQVVDNARVIASDVQGVHGR